MYDYVVLPGGMPGTTHLRRDERVCDVVREFAATKHVAAICAAPSILAELGLLEGRRATCFPGFDIDFPAGTFAGEKTVVKDGNIITASAMGQALPFALTVLEDIAGERALEKVCEGIQLESEQPCIHGPVLHTARWGLSTLGVPKHDPRLPIPPSYRAYGRGGLYVPRHPRGHRRDAARGRATPGPCGQARQDKALCVASEHARAGEIVVAADTIVTIDGSILGKPADAEDAKRMLRQLSGRTHQVATGVCVARANAAGDAGEPVLQNFVEVTDVTFYALDEDTIEAYARSGEPLDKAGAYGIQGKGGRMPGC